MAVELGQPHAGVPGAAFGRILVNEARVAVRAPIGVFLGLALPLLLLVAFGRLPKFQVPEPALGGSTRFDLYVPILLAFAIAAVALWSLPSVLTGYREHGILRRLATTPVTPAWLLSAQVLVNLGIAVLSLAILTLGSTRFLGFHASVDPAGMLVTVVLSLGALFGLGLFIAAVMPSSRAAYFAGAFVFFLSMFFAGMWVPRASMSSGLANFGNYTPLSASVQSLQAALAGTFPPTWALLVLAAYLLVFGALAIRMFRWE